MKVKHKVLVLVYIFLSLSCGEGDVISGIWETKLSRLMLKSTFSWGEQAFSLGTLNIDLGVDQPLISKGGILVDRSVTIPKERSVIIEIIDRDTITVNPNIFDYSDEKQVYNRVFPDRPFEPLSLDEFDELRTQSAN
jgi:hypothetical protein